MPRSARKKCESGIYHVILRGQNKQIIFEDDEDRIKFLKTLYDCREKSKFYLFGYCLMGNHIHLLMQEHGEELGIIMRRIGASYVYWYNIKYERCGHLFQDRYRSEVVNNDRYFLTVLRYIHQNPLKAGISENLDGYKWSSYHGYVGQSGIIDTNFALSMFGADSKNALVSFIRFHSEFSKAQCLEIDNTRRLSDEQAIGIIKDQCGITSCLDMKLFERTKRDECVSKLRHAGLSARQIQRLTGINREIILRG